MNRRRRTAVQQYSIVGRLLLGTFLLGMGMLLSSKSDAQERRPIPTQLPPIVLPLNGKPVEVRESDLSRYVCAMGRLVATLEAGAARVSTRRITLRCIAD